jgi:DNA processing protein
VPGKRAADLRRQLEKLPVNSLADFKARAVRQIKAAHRLGAAILTYSHPAYPRNVYESNYPVPALYARGKLEVLGYRQAVACVGSRQIREPYAQLHEEFAKAACTLDFTVVSGFALGADSIGHRAAWEARGRTIAVMPCGLDRPFPPENRPLWEELLHSPLAVFVSEFAFGIRASSLTLRKRNKLIVAFACGVLLSQSSSSGGAMNAYRFAREQHKPIATFEPDSTEATSGNQQIKEMVAARDLLGSNRVLSRARSAEEYKEWLRALSSSI